MKNESKNRITVLRSLIHQPQIEPEDPELEAIYNINPTEAAIQELFEVYGVSY